MRRMLRYDFSVMVRKKEFIFTLAAMLIFSVYALYASIQYQKTYSWYDYNLISAEFMTVLFVMNKPWQVFTYLFAFLVVLPYALSYLSETEAGLLPVLLTRVTKRQYYLSKMITCFTGNALLVVIPLLLQYLFCNCIFPSGHNAGGIGEYGMSNYAGYVLGTRAVYAMKYPIIPLADFLLSHPRLYFLAYLLQLGAVAGALGVFVLNLSFLLPKYRALLFLPVFLLIRLSSALNRFFVRRAIMNSNVTYVNISLMEYLGIGDSSSLSPWFLPLLVLLIGLFSLLVVFLVMNSDRLLLDDSRIKGKERRG